MSSAAALPRTALQVGLFSLLSLGLLVGCLYWLRGKALHQGPSYSVAFDDVDGLRQGAPVQLMGLRIGFVEAIKPTLAANGRYTVTIAFRVSDDAPAIPKASVLSIEQSGLLSEKLIEITPPKLHRVELETPLALAAEAVEGRLQVSVPVQGGLYVPAGVVERLEPLEALSPNRFTPHRKYHRYALWFRLNKPGFLLPEFPAYSMNSTQGPVLVNSSVKSWQPPPMPTAEQQATHFTLEPPLRLKAFLDSQMESAKSLRVVNERLSGLLDKETVEDLQQVLANVRQLSGQASTLLQHMDAFFQTLNGDARTLVKGSHALLGQLNLLSANLNSVLADPNLKADLKQSMKELAAATHSFNALLNDPELKSLLHETHEAASGINQLSKEALLKLRNEKISEKFESSLGQIGKTMLRLDQALDKASAFGGKQSANVEALILDAKVTSKNLRVFSEKVKGHFALWKLMF